jgi:hypothetical protein
MILRAVQRIASADERACRAERTDGAFIALLRIRFGSESPFRRAPANRARAGRPAFRMGGGRRKWEC